MASPSALAWLASIRTISAARPLSSNAYAKVAPTLPTPTTATLAGLCCCRISVLIRILSTVFKLNVGSPYLTKIVSGEQQLRHPRPLKGKPQPPGRTKLLPPLAGLRRHLLRKRVARGCARTVLDHGEYRLAGYISIGGFETPSLSPPAREMPFAEERQLPPSHESSGLD